MNGLRRALLISFADKYSALIINIVVTVILSRLLTPEEIGVFSVAAVFVFLATIMREFGVGDYLIQAGEVTQQGLNAAFTLMLAISWSLAALLWGISGLAANFYQEPGVEDVIHVLALSFILVPFGAVFMALLRREMKFGISYRIHLAQNIVHAVTGISLAFWGFGYMSLAWASLAGVVVTVLGATWYRPKTLRLGLSFSGLGKVARFGGWVMTSTVFEQLAERTPELVIGKAQGMAPVGFYSRANGLVQMFDQMVMNAAAPVVMPHFSILKRAGGGEVAAHFIKATSYVTAMAWPFYALLALLAEPVIHVLYGNQWAAAVPLAQALCLFGAMKAFTPYPGMIMRSLGKARDEALVQAGFLLILLLTLVGTYAHGLNAIVWGVVLAGAGRTLLMLERLKCLVGFSWTDYAAAILKSGLLSSLALAIPLMLWLSLKVLHGTVWLGLLVMGCTTLIFWVLALHLIRHPLYAEVIGLFRRVRPRWAAINKSLD
ncbi:MAG TPA: lipopolysaccharide biosynthesis protein [Gammaproteobacteria bacterium]|nr:lipopolysaccharide biosynthesis protein [Gammaproteobacteria bacterium]